MPRDPDFDGFIQPPDVPPDTTGEDWRGVAGPPGPPGPPGPQGPSGASVPQVPGDGQIYGRGGITPVWGPTLPLSGGSMSGAVALAGVSTAPLAAPGTNTSQIASTAFVTAATTAALTYTATGGTTARSAQNRA